MRTIAIVTPKIDTFSNPTLILLIEKLLEKEYKILFFGFEQLFTPKELRGRINFYELPFNFYKFRRKPSSLWKLVKQYIEVYKILKIDNKVNAIICVDPMGLVIAGRIKRLVNVKLVYASFEIFFEDEFFIQRKKILKELEMKYSKHVDIVVIQDQKRQKLLCAVNNFQNGTKFLQIPVAPRNYEISMNEYDIHDALRIPREKIIVVYSGTLQNWSGINELINLFPYKWNSDFWLIVHSHYKLNDNDEIKNRIDKLIKDKQQITFHNEAFYDYSEYSKFLSKCNIGIATYFPNTIDIFAGKNLQVIGLSSGKFSTYMMLGIPTITTRNTTYKELNEKFRFGELISTMDDMPDALKKVRADYNQMTNGCKELYQKVLNPVNRIDNLIDEVSKYYSS